MSKLSKAASEMNQINSLRLDETVLTRLLTMILTQLLNGQQLCDTTIL